MPHEPKFIVPVARRCRDVAAAVIAGLWPGRDAEYVGHRLSGLPLRLQFSVVGGVLGMLFLVSLFAAQFGLLGMALLFLAVIILVS